MGKQRAIARQTKTSSNHAATADARRHGRGEAGRTPTVTQALDAIFDQVVRGRFGEFIAAAMRRPVSKEANPPKER
jgi:hypothetical protein